MRTGVAKGLQMHVLLEDLIQLGMLGLGVSLLLICLQYLDREAKQGPREIAGSLHVEGASVLVEESYRATNA